MYTRCKAVRGKKAERWRVAYRENQGRASVGKARSTLGRRIIAALLPVLEITNLGALLLLVKIQKTSRFLTQLG
jgi:hypothetical protein